MIWALKIAGKLVLSRLAGRYEWRRRLGIFKHGAMRSADYAISTVQGHVRLAREYGLKNRFSALELGPGDSVAGALVARYLGATRTWLIDDGPFATTEMHVYKDVEAALIANGDSACATLAPDSFATFLAWCNATYECRGLDSMRAVPSGSVDFTWSQAVLEHVRLADFHALIAELYRVTSPGGLASHRVDLRDHLSGGLNNLRFSTGVWEAEWMARSGFYTNRIRSRQMVNIFRDVGFDVLRLKEDRWRELPIERRSLAKPFRDLPNEDLLVSGFDVLLRKGAE